ncbi:hypothetical protein [Luteococcus japonicus]|uniref:Uncharacterized protein n=1 Tax=Luteococcus japonicus LSP_Lj1 TaxID=1255658 RepID=A0A1R4KKC6_9ACTN|nr:hypothetical protein [Luteococcus japonicus]SJN44800.1 hypothetical protein FM114_15405 [Luteococcus japonicus LSP_Lj1]
MINPFAPSRDSLVREQLPEWLCAASQRAESSSQQAPWPPVKTAAQREAAQQGHLRRAPRPTQYPASA